MIAYQVTGEDNGVDLVWAPGTVSHLELFWEFPENATLVERLSAFTRDCFAGTGGVQVLSQVRMPCPEG